MEKPFTDDDLGLLLPFSDDRRFASGETPLVELHLEGTAITDNAGKTIAKLHRLRQLYVNKTAVGAEFCRSISTLSELFLINMEGCTINGGVKYLQRLPLVDLNLMYTDLDDAGLRELAEIKTLLNLHIGRTHVSETAVKAFQEARPDVVLIH